MKSCNCLACLYFQVKPKTCLKSYIFGSNFVSDLAQFEGSKVHFVGLHVRPGGSGPLNSNLIISPISISPMQARSQKFAMGGLFWGSGGRAPSGRRPMGVWGRSPQPPEAGGLGAKPPAAGGTGVWGRRPQRSKILRFFAKITSF